MILYNFCVGLYFVRVCYICYSDYTSIHIVCLHLHLQVQNYNTLYGAILDHVRSTGKEIRIPEGCPLVRLQNCLPMNVVYWPANPMALLEKLNQEINGEESKSSSPDDPHMVVITHHEEVPVVVNRKSKKYKVNM